MCTHRHRSASALCNFFKIFLLHVGIFVCFFNLDWDNFIIFGMFMLQCYHVPYTSMTMLISENPSERDSATAFRE